MKFKIMTFFMLTLAIATWDIGWTLPTTGEENFLVAQTKAPIICPEPPPDRSCHAGGRGSIPEIKITNPPIGALLPGDNSGDNSGGNSGHNQLILSWSNAAGATEYNVRLEKYGQTVWEVTVSETEIVYPENQPPLEPGNQYELIVEPIGNDQSIAPGRGKFKVVTEEDANIIREQAARISGISDAEIRLNLAELYRKNQLLADAIATLKEGLQKNPQSVELHQKLGDIYREAELPELAKSPYQAALRFANSPQQKADAQIGLARVNIAEQNWSEAIEHLTAARDNYLSINYPAIAAQLAQFIGEVYQYSQDTDNAIRWYNTAKKEYETLGQPNRVEQIERILGLFRS